MRANNIVPALAVAVSPHAPGLARRQLISGTNPGFVDQLPPDCRAAAEAAVSAMPAEPTLFLEFSSSYYDTEERTATKPSEDCAWITEMPEAAYTAYNDYLHDSLEWSSDPDTMDLMLRLKNACEEVMMDENLMSLPCQIEWSEFAFDAMKGGDSDFPIRGDGFGFPTLTGSMSGHPTDDPENDDDDGVDFTPGATESGSSYSGDTGNDAENDQDSSASFLVTPVAALLASFIGGMAML